MSPSPLLDGSYNFCDSDCCWENFYIGIRSLSLTFAAIPSFSLKQQNLDILRALALTLTGRCTRVQLS